MRLRRPGVVGFWANQAVIANLFQDMGRPAYYPTDCEGWRKEVIWQSNRSE
jgi:hypothetical protein